MKAGSECTDFLVQANNSVSPLGGSIANTGTAWLDVSVPLKLPKFCSSRVLDRSALRHQLPLPIIHLTFGTLQFSYRPQRQ